MIYFKKKNKIEKNKGPARPHKNSGAGGYAILFAVVIVSIISLLVAGLSNTTFKELILTSVARDSSTAFFQSDTAAECALYADNFVKMTSTSFPTPSWICGVDSNNKNIVFTISSDANMGYQATLQQSNTTLPCFDFDVQKPPINNPGDPGTDIFARGYNICNKTSPKTVERELEITY